MVLLDLGGVSARLLLLLLVLRLPLRKECVTALLEDDMSFLSVTVFLVFGGFETGGAGVASTL